MTDITEQQVIRCAVDGAVGSLRVGRKTIGAMCMHIACNSNECRDKTGKKCEHKVKDPS